ncbi:MAG: hypothetical protein BWY90_01012 [Deltaproteobacteria bacterium ADurb.BinA014]|nr:MAG: hypothetical protein BWY90_01012 [Deltaproteobacteria bacterium ADurb.BinA014]
MGADNKAPDDAIRKDFQLTPIKKIIEADISTMIKAVPKSGCFKISRKGSMMISAGTISSLSLYGWLDLWSSK